MHRQVIDVIRLDPEDRNRHSAQMVVPWLKSKSHLLSELDSDVLTNLVCKCDYTKSVTDEMLIKQGEVGDCLYIILEGSVSVFIDENFDEKSERSPRRNTPSPRFDRLVVRHPSAKRDASTSQHCVPVASPPDQKPEKSENQLGNQLEVPHEEPKLERTRSGATSRQSRPGSHRLGSQRGGSASRLPRKGNASQAGKSALRRKSPQPAREKNVDKLAKECKFIVSLGVGQCFGEIALISEDNRRNASVVAAEDTHLLVIRKSLYDNTLKEFHEREFAERRHFVERHPLFHKWKAHSKHLLVMSLVKKTLPFEATIVSQGDPIDGLIFIVHGSASVMVESSKHNQQYPNMYPFLQQSDVYSETYRQHQRDRYVTESKRQQMADHRASLRDRRRDYAAVERRVKRRKLLLCTVQNPELIADIEYVCNLPTHAHSVVCTTLTDVFHLNGKNTDRLIVRKNPATLILLRMMVETKLRYRVNTPQAKSVPLLGYLLFQCNRKPKAPTRSLAQLRPSKTVPDEEYLFLHMMDSYLQDKAQLSIPLVPGAVYYRHMMREKARQRKEARQRLGISLEARRGPSWKTRQALSKARSTSMLRAALKRDEEDAMKLLADAKLRAEHTREEMLLQEMLAENREFIDDYLEKCERATDKRQPKDPAKEGDAVPPGGADITSGAVTNQNEVKPEMQEAGVAPTDPVQKERTFVTEMAPGVEVTAGDASNVQTTVAAAAEPVYDERSDTCYFPRLSRQTSLVKTVYTDWETSDKSLNYLERRLQLFNPTSGKRKAPVSLPKLKRFEAKTELLPGGKVIIQQKKCSFTKVPYRLLDHSHEHHHMIPAIPEYDRLRRSNVLKHYMVDRLREKWIESHKA